MTSAASSNRLPDFLIGGAPRSGTTWLRDVLDRHPDVWMARPARPEPKFFLVDSEFDKGLEFYSRTWFANAPASALAGEKSSNYLESAVAAARIAAALPNVQLVFVLREPADRARSNYLWSKMNGLEPLGFREALDREVEREAVYPPKYRYSRPFSYFSRGLYAHHLSAYFDVCTSDRILVVRYEDLITRPSDVTATVHGFLGITSRPDDIVQVGRVNPSCANETDFADTVSELRARYDRPNFELATLLGRGFQLWT